MIATKLTPEPIAVYKRRNGVYDFVRGTVICSATWEKGYYGRLRVEGPGCIWVVPEVALSTITTATLNTSTLIHLAISGAGPRSLRILLEQDRYSIEPMENGIALHDFEGELILSTAPSWRDSEIAGGCTFNVTDHGLPDGPRGTLLLAFTLLGHGILDSFVGRD